MLLKVEKHWPQEEIFYLYTPHLLRLHLTPCHILRKSVLQGNSQLCESLWCNYVEETVMSTGQKCCAFVVEFDTICDISVAFFPPRKDGFKEVCHGN